MLDAIDALVALETFGTVSEAATRLRLTQSAVSKRLAALQADVGFRLLERQGRRLRLTPRAAEFLTRARPLVAELRALTKSVRLDAPRGFSLALADSIASSWGPAVVRRASSASPPIAIELHAHRSVLVVESVRLGRYDAGLCTEMPAAKDLVAHPVIEEPMALLSAAKGDRATPLLTIEATSATWRAIEPQLRAHHPALLARPRITVESFGAVVQMMEAGFGEGLVPLGLARETKVRKRARVLSGVARKVVLLTRKTVALQEGFVAFAGRVGEAARGYFA